MSTETDQRARMAVRLTRGAYRPDAFEHVPGTGRAAAEDQRLRARTMLSDEGLSGWGDGLERIAIAVADAVDETVARYAAACAADHPTDHAEAAATFAEGLYNESCDQGDQHAAQQAAYALTARDALIAVAESDLRVDQVLDRVRVMRGSCMGDLARGLIEDLIGRLFAADLDQRIGDARDALDAAEEAADDLCACGASLDDGEGFDGRCGACADRADRD